MRPMSQEPEDKSFEQKAKAPAPGIASDLVDFLRHGKRWWLTPIILVLVVVGVFLALGAAGAPFIYTLF